MNPIRLRHHQTEGNAVRDTCEALSAPLRSAIIEATEAFRRAIEVGDKDYLRELHCSSKRHLDRDAILRAREEFEKLEHCFGNPSKINVRDIAPRLINVEQGSLYRRLFKLIRHTWSMPFSKGYGRRMRFLVWDDAHDAVIGIIGFQSPPADLKCRDAQFNYPASQKLDLVNQTMDIYTLGAVPPYSALLGGKLVAGLVCSDPIRQAYWQKYAGKNSQMNNSLIHQPLVAATTTSAFGRSSIYNRLRYGDRLLARPIGFTSGYGTIHLEGCFSQIEHYLKLLGIHHNGGFGRGPKPRWQNAARAMRHVKLPGEYLKHGLAREVFLFEFCESLESGMAGKSFGNPIPMGVDEYASYWLRRWAIPRAERYPEWAQVDVTAYVRKCLST